MAPTSDAKARIDEAIIAALALAGTVAEDRAEYVAERAHVLDTLDAEYD